MSSDSNVRRKLRQSSTIRNIVPVFGVGQQGDRYFYVMQYIDGQGLDAVVRELRLLLEPSRSRDQSETVEMQDDVHQSGSRRRL